MAQADGATAELMLAELTPGASPGITRNGAAHWDARARGVSGSRCRLHLARYLNDGGQAALDIVLGRGP